VYGVTRRTYERSIRQVIEVNIVGERHIYSIHKTIVDACQSANKDSKRQQRKAGTEKKVPTKTSKEKINKNVK